MLKASGDNDTLAIFRIPAAQKEPEHDTVRSFTDFDTKPEETYDTLAIFKFLLLKKGPEHESVRIFTTFNVKNERNPQ